MSLHDKVRQTLLDQKEFNKSESIQDIELLADRFYAHYIDNLGKHMTVEEFIKKELNKE